MDSSQLPVKNHEIDDTIRELKASSQTHIAAAKLPIYPSTEEKSQPKASSRY